IAGLPPRLGDQEFRPWGSAQRRLLPRAGCRAGSGADTIRSFTITARTGHPKYRNRTKVPKELLNVGPPSGQYQLVRFCLGTGWASVAGAASVPADSVDDRGEHRQVAEVIRVVPAVEVDLAGQVPVLDRDRVVARRQGTEIDLEVIGLLALQRHLVG